MAMAIRAINPSIFASLEKLNGYSSSSGHRKVRVLKFPAIKAVQTRDSRQKRPQNVEGDFFVDHTCIDCDTCRWMAPKTFTRVDEMSAVYKQPVSKEERFKALQALISCPTGSIRTEVPPTDNLEVQKTFPYLIDEQKLPGVYHCGYHSEDSYGAASFLIIHPAGNILVDSPRFNEKLARNIEQLGGAHYMFLTHIDDVADHKKWSKRIGCERILHIADVEASTSDVEIKLEGSGPWSLGNDVTLIHTPGHSEGSICLFHRTLEIIFTGDHIAMTESGFSMFEQYNKCSVPTQLKSVEKLLELDFRWIIPGHGRRVEFEDFEEKNSALKGYLESKYSRFSNI